MRFLRSRVTHALVALAVGSGAAAATVSRMGDDDWTVPEPRDRVAVAIASLEDDPVYVSPDGRAWLDEDGEAAVEAHIAERDLPVRVVVWQPSTKAGYQHPTLSPAQQIVTYLDEPVLLVLWQGPDDSLVDAPDGWKTRYPGYDETWEQEPTFLGDTRTDLEDWLSSVPTDVLEESTGSDYYGGTGGGIAFGLLVGLPVVGGIALAAGLVRLGAGRGFRARPPSAPSERR
ncbi:hypothetical protein [Nocardioides zeae]|uniref:Uncharacterized protein n=1 Tax=Nocardioides zeae TaxID=1457234 RepID=A0A6P0HL77_9ACTN|nr:hypothetical protein [Nocardioides zeae]NEN79428.1 hypothetical protein [Nocardioides zeae]